MEVENNIYLCHYHILEQMKGIFMYKTPEMAFAQEQKETGQCGRKSQKYNL